MHPLESSAWPRVPKIKLTSKGQAFLAVFVGEGSDRLGGEAGDVESDAGSGAVLSFPCRPLEGIQIAEAAQYCHDAGDRKRVLSDLGPLLHRVPNRGFMLRSDWERLPNDSWWLLTKREQRLLASMSSSRLAPLLRPSWVLDALSIKTRIDLADLRRRGSFSGALIAELAGMPYDSDVAKDLAALTKAGILRRHNRGFLADQWPSDAEVRPLDVEALLAIAATSDSFFSTPSEARSRTLRELKIEEPEPAAEDTRKRGILVPGSRRRIAPHVL